MPCLPLTGAGPSAGVDPYAAYLFYDSLTDSNGTEPDAHTPEKDSSENGWTEVDTGDLIDIQSNALHIECSNDGADPNIYIGTFARAVGRELCFTITPGQTNGQLRIGLWGTTTLNPTGTLAHFMWFYSDGNIYCREGGLEGAASAYTTAEAECKIVLKATGAEYWYGGVKIADLAVKNTDPLYFGVGTSIAGKTFVLDDITISD